MTQAYTYFFKKIQLELYDKQLDEKAALHRYIYRLKDAVMKKILFQRLERLFGAI